MDDERKTKALIKLGDWLESDQPAFAWSDEPPTNPGWYWKGNRETDHAVIVCVQDDRWHDMNGDIGFTDDNTGVRWQPVAPPLA